MSYELSYGGIPFQLDTPELLARIESQISLSYLQETVPTPHWPGRNLGSIARPQWPQRPKPAIGQFFYPIGASRWAEFHGLMTQANVQKLLAQCVDHSTGFAQQTFVMRADSGLGNDSPTGVSTPMYLLPPRALYQVDGNAQGLYLVTLVDERYFSYSQTASVPQTTVAITWANMVVRLTTALNVAFDTSTIPTSANYGAPNLDSGLWTNNENPAYLLDAVAWNLGSFVVRDYSGNYSFQPFGGVPYLASVQTSRCAGHSVTDNPGIEPDAQGLIPSLECILPRNVVVTFPAFVANHSFRQQSGNIALEQPVRYIPWIKDSYHEVYFYSLSLDPDAMPVQDPLGNSLNGYKGLNMTKVLHSTARAYFTLFSDSTPVNDTALNAMAKQLAQDYWAFLANGRDEVYPGVRNWSPDQTHDQLIVYRHDGCYSRVMRLPWNTAVTEFSHALTGADGPNAGPALELVRANTGTPDGSGRYDAYVRRRGSGSYSDVNRVWLLAANGETLTNNTQYLARLMSYENGRMTYATYSSGGGGGGSPLTVELSDTSVSISNVSTIDLDIPADWTLTTTGAGEAKMATKGFSGSFQVCQPSGATPLLTFSNGLLKTKV